MHCTCNFICGLSDVIKDIQSVSFWAHVKIASRVVSYACDRPKAAVTRDLFEDTFKPRVFEAKAKDFCCRGVIQVDWESIRHTARNQRFKIPSVSSWNHIAELYSTARSVSK